MLGVRCRAVRLRGKWLETFVLLPWSLGDSICTIAPSSTIKCLAEQSKPGKFNYGSSGNYGTMHVPMEMLKANAKFSMTHIPYTGAGPADIEKSVTMPIERFTLIGATTRFGLLTAPMRARFGLAMRLDLYPVGDLEEIVRRTAAVINVELHADGAHEIARGSRGTPRIANRLLRRVRDYAQVRAGGVITKAVANDALGLLDVDDFGLDDMDARIVKTIIEKFDGGPVGVASLAAAIGEDAGTIEEVYEPFLVQNGLLHRTSRGRVATPQAYRHFGFTPPSGAQAELL